MTACLLNMTQTLLIEQIRCSLASLQLTPGGEPHTFPGPPTSLYSSLQLTFIPLQGSPQAGANKVWQKNKKKGKKGKPNKQQPKKKQPVKQQSKKKDEKEVILYK